LNGIFVQSQKWKKFRRFNGGLNPLSTPVSGEKKKLDDFDRQNFG